jgi:hypothetical protein
MIPAAVALLISTTAVSEDLKASFTPREMAHCMMKRLRAHNNESYRDAYKTCKQQFDSAEADRATETAMTGPTPPAPAKP